MSRKKIGPDAFERDRQYKELQIHQTELEEQNRELRETQQRLEESRDRYAELYDFAPVGYVDLDERGSIRGINLTGSTMLGEARARLLGISFTRFVAPDDRGKFRGHLEKCREAKGRATSDVVLRPKDGPPFPAQLQSAVSIDGERGLVTFRTTITNLSERKLAEEALRESEERFRSLVKDALVGFFIARDGKIVFMNPEQEKLFGPVPDSLELAEFENVHPEDRGKFLALCGEGDSADFRTGSVDIRLFCAGARKGDGEVRWAHCRGSRIVWEGRAARLVNMLDVTKTRELERIAQVQEKMAALGHVAAGIAHEIRNPLSGININLSSLEQLCDVPPERSPEERERIEEAFRHMKDASAKIATVVQRVLDFSKPVPPRLEPADVNQAIEEAVALASVTLRSHKVKLKKSLSVDLPKCPADLRLIGQVLLNLITNADQAMDGARDAKRLTINTRKEGRWILIEVSDSGPGVPQHLREKIFDPYFTTRRDGTGIGLSFCHQVITGHGGAISVGRSPHGGALFRIRLPFERREGRT